MSWFLAHFDSRDLLTFRLPFHHKNISITLGYNSIYVHNFVSIITVAEHFPSVQTILIEKAAKLLKADKQKLNPEDTFLK